MGTFDELIGDLFKNPAQKNVMNRYTCSKAFTLINLQWKKES